MRNIIKQFKPLFFSLILIMVSFQPGSAASNTSNYDTWATHLVSDTNKTWRISFSAAMKSNTVNTNNIFVINRVNEVIPIRVNLLSDNRTVTVSPIQEYKTGEEYRLYLTDEIRSTSGTSVINPTILPFVVKGNDNFNQNTTRATNNNLSTSQSSSSQASAGTTNNTKQSQPTSNTNATTSSSSSNTSNSSSNTSSSSSNTSNSSTTNSSNPTVQSPVIDVEIVRSTFLTSVKVITDGTVAKVTANYKELHFSGNSTFSIGLAGVNQGDSVRIDAYDGNNKKVYSKTHTIN